MTLYILCIRVEDFTEVYYVQLLFISSQKTKSLNKQLL